MKKIYCRNCKTVTNHIPKLDALKDGKMVCDECSYTNSYCTLLKPEQPSFIKTSLEVIFILINAPSGKNEIKETYDVGLSLIMSPFNECFTWMTTPITEILDTKENYVKFKTENSIYELYYTTVYNNGN